MGFRLLAQRCCLCTASLVEAAEKEFSWVFSHEDSFLYDRHSVHDKSRIAGMRLYESYVKLFAL